MLSTHLGKRMGNCVRCYDVLEPDWPHRLAILVGERLALHGPQPRADLFAHTAAALPPVHLGESLCVRTQPAKHKPWANRKPTNHARGHMPYKMHRGSKTVLMCLLFSPDEAGLRECLSQDRRSRARTLPTHLPSTNDATLTALALHPSRGRPRKVETVGGGTPGRPLYA